MTSITALLHTENDALRVGRVLETLYPCDQILVVDHGSRDASVRIAREYGARVVDAADGDLAGGLSSLCRLSIRITFNLLVFDPLTQDGFCVLIRAKR